MKNFSNVSNFSYLCFSPHSNSQGEKMCNDETTCILFTDCTNQMLGHLHCNWGDLLTVFTDHLLNDIGEVIVLRLPDDVEECLHHWPDEGGDVLFG